MKTDYNIIIIGAGVIGLSIARSLGELGHDSILVIEKEKKYGSGVSSRSSEVIHSGIYHSNDYFKSKLCIEGRTLLYEYCDKNKVFYKNCGKIIVTSLNNERNLRKLYEYGKSKGLDQIYLINKTDINQLEPNVSGDLGILINYTGIIDSHSLMRSFYNESIGYDCDFLFATSLLDASYQNPGYTLKIKTSNYAKEEVSANWIINAAGLSSDVVAKMLSKNINTPELYFSKGSYVSLASKWKNKFNHLVYPMPEKNYDSLGVHITFDQSGDARLGPDSVSLSRKIENYNFDNNIIDKFYSEASKYIPTLSKNDLSPAYIGIRPKIISNNSSIKDFYINHEASKGFKGWINLIGIESPGLTSSISIGNLVSKLVR
tara:strand:- start:1240 stop:2361 length:1122 start_codon:yes stop_codon:yes gene_type:complete